VCGMHARAMRGWSENCDCGHCETCVERAGLVRDGLSGWVGSSDAQAGRLRCVSVRSPDVGVGVWVCGRGSPLCDAGHAATAGRVFDGT